ncbi:putative LPS assembly protein LptD [Rhodohalobacter halophilus]|uniref:putative LPS assembly protein LptD n=1 Tax=Rhodohalobacter halophilus TaxID=1812810 RepID=UPI00083FA10C|nr:putative LPS assembly protein LptD [Rhodohalobacter halophilus]
MQNRLFRNRKSYLLVLFCLLGLTVWSSASAQVVSDSLRPAARDTIPSALQDTLRSTEIDTIPPPEQIQEQTPQTPQTRQADRKSAPDAVNFQARDSLTFNFRNQRIANLYGSSNVKHTNGELSAGTIELNLNMNQVEARTDTPNDTLSYPILRRQDDEMRSTRILFNYETEKGKFEVAELQMDDGYLIGTKVKNVSRNEVFIEEGIYSTCPPDHMYYYIQADRMKVVDEEEVFFTNARLFILDIPYPLVFPFGYVPAGIESRRSGLLEPTYVYQNTSTRGIGLQNLGWFQYFNDYITAQTSFDLFTSGTFFNESRMQYRSTGQFNGNIVLGYSREQGLEPTDPGFSETINKRLSISHDQQLSPYANLTANINLRTSNYFQRNSFDPNDRASTSSTSRISYRYSHPEGAFNFSTTANLNQQFTNNQTRLTGPEFTFSARQFSPFKSDQPGLQDEKWYERITVNYRNNFKSEFNFTPIDADSAEINWFDALLDPSKYREATGNDDHLQLGFIQRVGISAGQLIPSQFLNVSANFNLNEYWFPSSIRKEWNDDENQIETNRVRGFASARDFSTSLNFSTTFYGISQMNVGNFEGLRHTVRPNVSFSYSPDFSDPMWGVYREVQSDSLGNTQEYSIFEDEIFSGPGRGEQMTMSFGITNIFETKQVKRDSTGEVRSNNLRLIDNLSVNSGYNFAADSLNFQRVNMSLSSRVVDGLRISANASYSMYTRNETGREINTFIWEDSNKFLQPLSYSLNLSTSFSGGSRGPRITTPPYRPYDPLDQTFFSPVDQRFNMQPVQRADTPWSVGLDFSYRWTYQFGQDARKSAVLNANNIQFNLTPKWRVSTRIGYDFIEKELTPSQFSLQRDMICWNLSFQFNPFGDFQYYFFRLSLSSSQIQGLFQKLPLLNNLERSSSPSGRNPRF